LHERAPCGHGVGAGLVAGGIEIETLLREGLLGLANQRILGAALIDRHRELRDGLRAERLLHRELLLIGLLRRCLQGERGQQRALPDLDLQVVDVDAKHGGGDVRILDQAEFDGGRQRTREEAIDRRARR